MTSTSSYLENKVLCKLFVEELKLAKRIKKFELYGFVILYDHAQLMIKPDLKIANLSKIMFSIKKQSTHDANRVLGHNDFFKRYRKRANVCLLSSEIERNIFKDSEE